MNTFQVRVDADLEAIIPRYFEIQQEQVRILEQAIQGQDSSTIQSIGHKLKGTGSSYGFPELTELGAALEIAGKNNALSEAREIKQTVLNFLNHVEVIYI